MPVIIQSMETVTLTCNQLNIVTNRIQINDTIYSVTNVEELRHDIQRLKLTETCRQHQGQSE